MDALSHMVFSLAGGYIIARHLDLKLKYYTIPLLAVISILIDLDHVLFILEITNTLLLHNIALVLLLTVILRLFSGRNAAMLLSVMLTGHLLMDMNTGIYGIPLLYPLTAKAYLIPEGLELLLFGDYRNPVISRTGISLALYFGLVAAIVLLDKIRQKR